VVLAVHSFSKLPPESRRHVNAIIRTTDGAVVGLVSNLDMALFGMIQGAHEAVGVFFADTMEDMSSAPVGSHSRTPTPIPAHGPPSPIEPRPTATTTTTTTRAATPFLPAADGEVRRRKKKLKVTRKEARKLAERGALTSNPAPPGLRGRLKAKMSRLPRTRSPDGRKATKDRRKRSKSAKASEGNATKDRSKPGKAPPGIPFLCSLCQHTIRKGTASSCKPHLRSQQHIQYMVQQLLQSPTGEAGAEFKNMKTNRVTRITFTAADCCAPALTLPQSAGGTGQTCATASCSARCRAAWRWCTTCTR